MVEAKSVGLAAESGLPELRSYLRGQYSGVLDERGLEALIRDYVGFTFADQVAPLVAAQIPPSGKVLDVGSGYGAFVVASRRLGLEAVGVEIEPFEVYYARSRLEQVMPHLSPEEVFYLADALELPFDKNSFDAVTLWNVLEHVSDGERLLSECRRVLCPGGLLFVICPNYAAFREEAHYHIVLPPLLPKRLAAAYLRLRGRNPGFLETRVSYRTNWGVLRLLRKLHMKIGPLDHFTHISPTELHLAQMAKLRDPALVRDPQERAVLIRLMAFYPAWAALVWFWNWARLGRLMSWAARSWAMAMMLNPFKGSIVLAARKVEE
jgi:MPBQ/MSBQ methyltransferase